MVPPPHLTGEVESPSSLTRTAAAWAVRFVAHGCLMSAGAGCLDPASFDSKQWTEVIKASQHSTECSRLLLVEDDFARKGLGFSSLTWADVLLLAMQHNRVLLEVPVSATFAREELTGVAGPRWCTQPPHTLQCFYDVWSQCQVPDPLLHVAPRTNARKGNASRWPSLKRLPNASVVRAKLSWLRISPLLNKRRSYASESAFLSAAVRFLFSPRRWVRALGTCVMNATGLHRHRFISLFIRGSDEKWKEMSQHGHRPPEWSDWCWVVRRLVVGLGPAWQRVHLQTSSGDAARFFAQFATQEKIVLAMTKNRRTSHDLWGGWSTDNETIMSQATSAAVNQYIGSQAGIFISPVASAWTTFMLRHMQPAQTVASMCCNCREKDIIGSLDLLAAASTSATPSLRANAIIAVSNAAMRSAICSGDGLITALNRTPSVNSTTCAVPHWAATVGPLAASDSAPPTRAAVPRVSSHSPMCRGPFHA